MNLAHLSMLIHELLNNYPYVVPLEAPLIIFDGKLAVCMAKNSKDTKQTRQIARIVHFVRSEINCKMHNIDWCEGGLQLSEISTKNVGKHYLTPRMKYIMVRLDK